jgi:hypothetical protein
MRPPLLLRYLLSPFPLSKYLVDLPAHPFDSISPSNSNRSRTLSTVKRQYGDEPGWASDSRKNGVVESAR